MGLSRRKKAVKFDRLEDVIYEKRANNIANTTFTTREIQMVQKMAIVNPQDQSA